MNKAEQLASELTGHQARQSSLVESAAELRRLAPMEAQNTKLLADNLKLIDDLFGAKSRIKELEDALIFYADKTNYTYSVCNDGGGHFDVSESNVHDDGGVIARKALGETK